jgi:hypothetical protein
MVLQEGIGQALDNSNCASSKRKPVSRYRGKSDWNRTAQRNPVNLFSGVIGEGQLLIEPRNAHSAKEKAFVS